MNMEINKSNGIVNVLQVLAYFDVFEYPLTIDEIKWFLCTNIGDDEIYNVLEKLLAEECIFKINEFYLLKNDISRVEKRLDGNKRAQGLFKTAQKTCKVLSRFPFVRSIAISGSLSKNCTTEKDDIDYFIITAPGRLWIARTFMHLFKKIMFLFNKQHWYCMNYFIDETELLIQEKNVYTAVEIATLIPMYGQKTMEQFFFTNEWTQRYFPKGNIHSVIQDIKLKNNRKEISELLLNNSWGNKLDNYLMDVTAKRWKNKEEAYKRNAKGQRMGMKATKHSCKPNPMYMQKRILKKYYDTLIELETKHNLNMQIVV